MGRITKAALAAMGMATAFALVPMAAHAGSYAGNTTACASGVSTVGIQLDAVQAAILGGGFTNERDRTNMLGKVNAAASKAAVRKWDDANGKLQDVSDQALALAGAAKPKLTGADAIVNAAYAAQLCMTGL
jgi:hypothetical protein